MHSNHPLEAYLVNAFADEVSSGSPTGVVLKADGLDEQRMLRIARAFGVSHTAFVRAPDRAGCDVAVRFFTPDGEIRNCAHATIAAHYVLATKVASGGDRTVRQEISTGVQEVRIRPSDGGPIVSFRQNEVLLKDISPDIQQRLRKALRITTADVHSAYPVRLASPGAYRFMVPLKTADRVIGLEPDLAELKRLCREAGSIGCFTFSLAASESGWEAHGRMFAPAIGVDEDVVNGNSSGCLGAYLMRVLDEVPPRSSLGLTVLQGHRFGAPATVQVEARRIQGRIETFVGGGARLTGAREVTA